MANGDKPDYNVCVPIERGTGKDRKIFWHRIGGAYAMKEGKDGFTIELQSLPFTTNRIVLVPPKEDDKSEKG